MRTLVLLSLALLSFGLTACKNEISATLTVEGEPFVPTACRSGEHSGFMGVDLIEEASDRTLRLVQTPANQPLAIWIAGTETIELGPCGTLSIGYQNSTINDIRNVEGNASLECEAGERVVTGTVAFKNCH